MAQGGVDREWVVVWCKKTGSCAGGLLLQVFTFVGSVDKMAWLGVDMDGLWYGDCVLM